MIKNIFKIGKFTCKDQHPLHVFETSLKVENHKENFKNCIFHFPVLQKSEERKSLLVIISRSPHIKTIIL